MEKVQFKSKYYPCWENKASNQKIKQQEDFFEHSFQCVLFVFESSQPSWIPNYCCMAIFSGAGV